MSSSSCYEDYTHLYLDLSIYHKCHQYRYIQAHLCGCEGCCHYAADAHCWCRALNVLCRFYTSNSNFIIAYVILLSCFELFLFHSERFEIRVVPFTRSDRELRAFHSEPLRSGNNKCWKKGQLCLQR